MDRIGGDRALNTPGTRTAALALAAMHPTDRRWMLARLPTGYRHLLDPLIAEALRFASVDTGLVREVLAGLDPNRSPEVPSPDVLIAVLQRLSTQWVARVLVAAVPDHAELYLATCDKIRGVVIRREMTRLPHPFPIALAASISRHLGEVGHELRIAEGAL
jgi:hypothetical protein